MATREQIIASSWLDLNVSMVSAANETKTIPTSVGEALQGIRSGKWAKLVGRVRDRYAKTFETAAEEGSPDPAAVAKKAVHRLKSNLPAVLFSGTLKKRADNEIEQHSGIVCIDLDNCQEPAELRSRLALDPYVQSAFISPTGSGVKALVRITPDAAVHLASFFAAQKYFFEAYGIEIDGACKNLSRLCYVTSDPSAFIREEDAKVFKPLEAEDAQAPEPQATPEPPLARYIDALVQ